MPKRIVQKPCDLASKGPAYHFPHILSVKQVAMASPGRGIRLYVLMCIREMRN